MENLPRIAYQMEYFQLEMMFLSLQAPIMIPHQYIRRSRNMQAKKNILPNSEGITLDHGGSNISYVKVPESLEELPSGLFPPERNTFK
ncbi:hypothetical protein TNCV_1307611 [Trichonephila clavipes]|nr:hypothetical protein TNCV_1307611 [Trichonephila clavipes]